jgi:hypothetical protein
LRRNRPPSKLRRITKNSKSLRLRLRSIRPRSPRPRKRPLRLLLRPRKPRMFISPMLRLLPSSRISSPPMLLKRRRKLMLLRPKRKPLLPPPHQTQLSKLLRRPPLTTIKKQRLRLRRIPLLPSKLSLPRRPSRLLTRKLSHQPHLMVNHGLPLCQSTSKLEDLSFNKDTKPSRARANPSLNPSLIPNPIATPSEHYTRVISFNKIMYLRT